MEQDVLLGLTTNIEEIRTDRMPFPVQAMAGRTDGIKDPTSIRGYGRQRQCFGSLGQGLGTSRDGQQTRCQGLDSRILGGEYLTSADAGKGASGQALGIHSSQDALHMERDAQQGTQDGIATSWRVSRPTSKQGNRNLGLRIADHGLERGRSEIRCGFIQGELE